MTSVGLWSAWMTLAIENVLPEPVTPSRVTLRAPPSKALTMAAMASPWSPLGTKSVVSGNVSTASACQVYLGHHISSLSPGGGRKWRPDPASAPDDGGRG